MTGDDLSRELYRELMNEIERLSMAIYGDKKLPPNGGGIYGQLKRIEEGMKGSEQRRDEQISKIGSDMRASESRRDEQIQRLEERLDAIDRRLRPRWWDYVIMAGGAAIATMLILQILTLLGHIG